MPPVIGPMPTAGVSFRVANHLVAAAAVAFTVSNPGHPAADVTFTVSRQHVESWEAPSLAARARIRVNGTFLPSLELVDGPEIEDAPIDMHNAEWTFNVRGPQWSLHRTERVFSKGTVVEIFLDHGVPGAVIEPEDPEYIGCVVGCDQKSRFEPSVTVRCRDASALYEKYETCEEFDPLTGKTRLDMTRDMAEAAGIANVIGPAGGTYDKPLQATNKKFFEVLKALWEPVGGRVRMLDFDTLEVSIPKLKIAPEPPDHVWRSGSWEGELQATPPEDSPSRWVVHATGVVLVDEFGVETEINEQVASALYAAKVATNQQLITGDIVATGLTPNDPVFQIISRIRTETAKRAGKIVYQNQLEWGFKNPRTARLVTAPSGDPMFPVAGSAGGGYNYVQSLIDEEGKFVNWWQEKFTVIGQRSTRPSYDADGTDIGSVAVRNAWYLQTMGVRVVGGNPLATNVVDAYVYDDDQSYSTRTEQWGQDQEIRLRRTYYTSGTQIGAQKEELQDTYEYRAIGSRVGEPDNDDLFQRYDGRGQSELIAQWHLIESKSTQDDLTSDKLVGGKRITISGWDAHGRPSGAYDWGEFKSNLEIEVFGFLKRDVTQFDVRSESQVEQVEYPADGTRVATLFMGVLPITRYTASVWTELQQAPIELIVDDETARRWFGFERVTLVHDFVQSLEEARTLIDLMRARRMGPKIQVTRPDCSAKVGDTVLLIDEASGVHERLLITRRHRNWRGVMPRGVYKLEKWRAA